MKKIAPMIVIGLALLSFHPARMGAAGAGGPSANGDFQFSLQDGQVRYITFDVRNHKNGETKGTMTFTDPAAELSPNEDAVGNALTGGLFVTAEFDCLKITANAAVMSGVITQSNFGGAVGQRVLLVVEDNEEGIKAPGLDKLTWGVYRSSAPNWIASDSELVNDPGVGLTWFATDSERTDDVPVPSNRSNVIGCQSFPISSYSFIDVQHGFGNIQVRP